MDTIRKLLNLCPVPMVILDENDKSLIVNDSFTRLLGYDINDIPDVNSWFNRAYPNDAEYRKEQEQVWKTASLQVQQKIDYNTNGRLARVTCKNGSLRILEIYGANIKQNLNLIVLIDITEKENLRADKEVIIQDLKRALDEVETLKGILPLCSICKKVRDDKGLWEQIDVYISKKSKAKVSHGLCPECLKKFYPDYYESLAKE